MQDERLIFTNEELESIPEPHPCLMRIEELMKAWREDARPVTYGDLQELADLLRV